MIAAKEQTLTVFLANDRQDKPLADLVSKTLKGAGFRVRSETRIRNGTLAQTAIRDALRASDAYVVLASTQNISSPWTPFELGAVMGLERPIFVIKVNADPLPPYLAVLRVFTPSELPELVDELKAVQGAADRSKSVKQKMAPRRRQPA